MKFILLVEGETEDLGVPGFLNRWLNKQFDEGSRIGIQAVRFEGWAELRDEAPNRAKKYLTDPHYADVIAVVSLLDLYGPTFYPADKSSVKERYSWGRKYMENRVREYFKEEHLPEDLYLKYHHFFAVHETEAWLLTRPDLFRQEVREALGKQKPPEQINFNTPPGKLLHKLYLEKLKRKYVKTTNARNIFPKLDGEAVADKCPYLREMLHELRVLALDAGAKPVGDWAQR